MKLAQGSWCDGWGLPNIWARVVLGDLISIINIPCNSMMIMV
jgi:hypothetical protein